MSTPGSAQRMQKMRWEKEIDDRNRVLTDEELDSILPPHGYEVSNPLPFSLTLLLPL